MRVMTPLTRMVSSRMGLCGISLSLIPVAVSGTAQADQNRLIRQTPVDLPAVFACDNPRIVLPCPVCSPVVRPMLAVVPGLRMELNF